MWPVVYLCFLFPGSVLLKVTRESDNVRAENMAKPSPSFLLYLIYDDDTNRH